MLLNNQQIIEEIKKEIKICTEMNENENTTTKTLWDTVKAVLRGRFIALQAHLKKQEKSQLLFFAVVVAVVQLLSHVRVFATPWTVALQASLSFTASPEFAQIYVH